MKSLSRENRLTLLKLSVPLPDIIEAFNSTSRYLDDLLDIDKVHFEQIVDQIYPVGLQLDKANSSDTEAPVWDFNLSVSYDTVSSKIPLHGTISILLLLISRSLMAMSLGELLMECIYFNLFVLLEHLLTLLTDFNCRNKPITA